MRQFLGTISASLVPPGFVVAGLQDNGNVFYTLDPSIPWRKVSGGDGGWATCLPGTFFLHNINGDVVQVTSVVVLLPAHISTTTVVAPVTSPPPAVPNSGLLNQIVEGLARFEHHNAVGEVMVAVASANGNEVYGLFSDDPFLVPAFHWERIGVLPLPAGQVIQSLGSVRGNPIYVGSSGGAMFKLDPATSTVVPQTVRLPEPSPSTVMGGGIFTRITGFDDAAMFALLQGATEQPKVGSGPLFSPVVQNYVMKLDGDAWRETAGFGLPNELMYGLVAVSARDPNHRLVNTLFVSQDGAVLVSRDDGRNWFRASSGLPRFPHCGDLRAVTDSGSAVTLYLGTYGRSVWSAFLA